MPCHADPNSTMQHVFREAVSIILFSVVQFLNTSKSYAFFIYAGILVGHLIFFGVATVLFRLKDKVMGTNLATGEAITSMLDEEDKKVQWNDRKRAHWSNKFLIWQLMSWSYDTCMYQVSWNYQRVPSTAVIFQFGWQALPNNMWECTTLYNIAINIMLTGSITVSLY